MSKLLWKPAPLLAPVPVVLVSCCRGEEPPNLITVAWAGTVCSEPPMIAVSIRPDRWSHDLIRDSGEFVVNVTTAALARATDYCGVVSGRDGDKFAGAKLTPAAAHAVRAPLVAESPLHLECRVREAKLLGSHTLFLGEVVAVQVEGQLLQPNGHFAIEQAGLLTFAHGNYYAVGRELGHFGFSVRRRGKARRSKAGQA